MKCLRPTKSNASASLRSSPETVATRTLQPRRSRLRLAPSGLTSHAPLISRLRRRTDSGPSGSPGRGSGRPARCCRGSPTGNSWRRRTSNRPGTPGTSPKTVRWDSSQSHLGIPRTSHYTTPTRSHACRTSPNHSRAVDQPDGSSYQSCLQTTRIRPIANHGH